MPTTVPTTIVLEARADECAQEVGGYVGRRVVPVLALRRERLEFEGPRRREIEARMLAEA